MHEILKIKWLSRHEDRTTESVTGYETRALRFYNFPFAIPQIFHYANSRRIPHQFYETSLFQVVAGREDLYIHISAFDFRIIPGSELVEVMPSTILGEEIQGRLTCDGRFLEVPQILFRVVGLSREPVRSKILIARRSKSFDLTTAIAAVSSTFLHKFLI